MAPRFRSLTTRQRSRPVTSAKKKGKSGPVRLRGGLIMTAAVAAAAASAAAAATTAAGLLPSSCLCGVFVATIVMSVYFSASRSLSPSCREKEGPKVWQAREQTALDEYDALTVGCRHRAACCRCLLPLLYKALH